jgi:putative membrane protein
MGEDVLGAAMVSRAVHPYRDAWAGICAGPGVSGAFALALLLAAGPALAHHPATRYAALDLAWTFDPRVILPMGLSALLYLVGTVRLWRRAGMGRGVRYWQAASFWAGWIFLALALVSPLHWLGEHLFTAHMIEHEILMVLAAPLLVLARPGGAMMWALPAGWRGAIGRIGRIGAFAALWRFLTEPLVATILHGAALWAWHMPVLYKAVLTNDFAHWLQHLSFFITALLFWWALLWGRARERGYGVAVLYLFATALHTGVLGVLLTLSRNVWYPGQAVFPADFGLTALEDQQLAGLVMWVPAGFVYMGAALALAGVWISRAGTRLTPGGVRP